ncbi:MAG: prepilin-type N-terminal cleavage/methylation domain-containing protein, partial [Opitutales bacterium]|nr:prepilin-type N-terminal cleavage/methylation domain-containing protein [Opitutales bacterium]
MKHIRRSFTLIEMLTVIAIIGILITLILPSVGQAIDRARQLKDENNLRQLAAAYINYLYNAPDKYELNACKNLYEFAGLLAKHGYLAAPEVYYASSDYLLSNRKPPRTIGRTINGIWRINSDFLNFPLGVVVITNISPSAPASTTPIAYTRGLDHTTGRWREAIGDNGGVYSSTGGFIAFLDGHIQFFSDLAEEYNQLVNFYTGENTSNIQNAVNHRARALNYLGIEWEAK